MRRQIISRAFYGWLAYCRHLSTVRTHLSGLVNGRITPECRSFRKSFYFGVISLFFFAVAANEEGLTREKWESMHDEGSIVSEMEVYRLVYFGGIQQDVRKDVWPYLLGHYS